MTIQILGSGCTKCKTLEANAKEAVANIQLDAVVEKITDMDTIIDMGVMVTPALAIDGEVKTTGKLLKPEQIEKILMEAK